MNLGKYAQTPTENRIYTVDYAQWLMSDETITGVTFGVTPATTPPFQIGAYALAPAGNALSFYASGGVDRQKYEVAVTVTTTLGQVKEDVIFFAVNDPL